MEAVPETRYARSGDVSIAYQVIGEEPYDLVFMHAAVGNLEVGWEQPLVVKFFERLSSFARVLTFDRRGKGLSDRGACRAWRGARLVDRRGPRGRFGNRPAKRGAVELKGVPGEWRLYAVERHGGAP